MKFQNIFWKEMKEFSEKVAKHNKVPYAEVWGAKLGTLNGFLMKKIEFFWN